MTTSLSPHDLADLVRPHLGTALVGFDVDGVLAPIVEHADDARLTRGVGSGLSELAERATVAIVSGRSLESLERLFDFAPELHVIGSHGLEVRGSEPMELDADERYTFDQLEILGTRAVQASGDGAWLEYKPASVVLHTRSADPELAQPAVEAVSNLARMIDGAQVKPGQQVVELLARTASKGDALLALAARHHLSPVVFLGDDVTDEDAFALMSDGDISVRVGPGDSVARYRLADPVAAADLIAELVAGIA